MFQFASGILNNSKILSQKKEECVSRIAEKRIAFEDIMQDMPREYRRCDPEEAQKEGITFIRLTNFLQVIGNQLLSDVSKS
jgi:hypothetical protein